MKFASSFFLMDGDLGGGFWDVAWGFEHFSLALMCRSDLCWIWGILSEFIEGWSAFAFSSARLASSHRGFALCVVDSAADGVGMMSSVG